MSNHKRAVIIASTERRKHRKLGTGSSMSAELATQVLEAGSFAVESAARVLAHGGLVAFPTETVYGLGADAGNGEAVARLYDAKCRPSFNPLIAHVANAAAAPRLAPL